MKTFTRYSSYTGLRPEIFRRIGSDRREVLDVGCANGTLGDAVKQRQGARVTGVEYDEALATEARGRLDRVITGDLNQLEDITGQLEGPYDCMVFADVLEHLQDPWGVLEAFTEHLTPDGEVVISLPNVGHLATFTTVFLRRTWPRRDRGLHDSTHLRWFARKDIEQLLEGASLRPVSWKRSQRFVDAPVALNKGALLVGWVPGLRDLLTYQFVVVARRGAST
ncbi:class I SAM-dependent methyltransferase [Phycicoccus sonneratiae]|uniref:Class I SAM-dependent methyltransferase n=1 Tax=Phycicoccus sonneratiae TaxID=2807628 RepID=A0ABS2CLD9_9MICO|nr:class I SAM-dependent methyltransferase [Phycicoccus sonneraticus]MBM6400679.1 class I SAM-dependent methyltransferase [Phycicoccus sonneraticus]